MTDPIPRGCAWLIVIGILVMMFALGALVPWLVEVVR